MTPARRMAREHKTIEAMIEIYCRGRHGGSVLCSDCRMISDYAHRRLARCPFQTEKTTCANCPVHCYRADMRKIVREIMRYSGPRMAWRHPVLALFHFVDGFKKHATKQRMKDTPAHRQ